jgi:homoserine dehydrogenase
VANFGDEFVALAKENGVSYRFEAAVGGGIPVIAPLLSSIRQNRMVEIRGILNGTTNYILTKMANEGSSYEEALKEAQRLGYAEFNPTADVEGFDATYKLSILSSLAFNKKICIETVYREGITGVDKEDIAYGKEMGYVVKLLAIGKHTKNGIEVRVHPTYVSKNNLLSSVNDSFNAVLLTGDAVGDVMLYGRGAGSLPTGSAIVSDVIFAAKHQEVFYAPFDNSEKGNKATKFAQDFNSKYCVRLSVKDEPGVLSKFSGIFAKNNISIEQVKQYQGKDGIVPVVIITHEVSEKVMNKALDKIKDLSSIKAIESVIRLED